MSTTSYVKMDNFLMLMVTFLLLSGLATCKWGEGEVQNGNETMGYYAGEVTDDGKKLPQGYGQFVLSDDFQFNGLDGLACCYEGQYQNGKRKGLGKFYGDNFVFAGEVDGVPNGKGLGIKDNKYWYFGEWQNGTISGQGAMFFPNNTVATGKFSNFSFVSGERYEIQEKPENMTQKSIFYFLNKKPKRNQSQNYELLFEQGKTLIGASSNMINKKISKYYYGEFSSDVQQLKAEGFGFQHTNSDYQWIGTWKNSVPSGKGILIATDEVKIGTWQGWEKFVGRTFSDIQRNLYSTRKVSSSFEDFIFKINLAKYQQNLRSIYLLSLYKALLSGS